MWFELKNDTLDWCAYILCGAAFYLFDTSDSVTSNRIARWAFSLGTWFGNQVDKKWYELEAE